MYCSILYDALRFAGAKTRNFRFRLWILIAAPERAKRNPFGCLSARFGAEHAIACRSKRKNAPLAQGTATRFDFIDRGHD
jgi:hypothetical protein